MRRIRFFAPIALLLAMLVWSPQASAFIAPLRTDGQHFYFHKVHDWQIAVARIDLTPRFDPASPDKIRHSWTVDGEIWLRNVSADEQSLLLAVADDPDHTGQTKVYVDGQRIKTALTDMEFDQSRSDIYTTRVRRFSVTLKSGEKAVIGVHMIVDATRRDDGQYVLQLPTNLFALLTPKILYSFVRIQLDARPIGLTSTLSGYTFYDSPLNRLTWFALDWKPRIPLKLAWLESWSLLTRIAEVEQCPTPWDVVRSVSQSDMKAVHAALAPYDAQTLQFCAALPLMLHGYVFPSSRVRDQFARIPLRRYLGKQARKGRIYRENPNFQRNDLPRLEYLYWKTLSSAEKD